MNAKKTIAELAFAAAMMRPTEDLALGYLRFEAVRRLHPREFEVVVERCMLKGLHFDQLIDELIVERQ